MHIDDGRRALDVLLNGPRTDLVVCDIMMPGLDGARLVTQLAASERMRDVPVLVVSAVDPDRLEQVLALPNVVGHFVKPADPEEIAARIEAALG